MDSPATIQDTKRVGPGGASNVAGEEGLAPTRRRHILRWLQASHIDDDCIQLEPLDNLPTDEYLGITHFPEA